MAVDANTDIACDGENVFTYSLWAKDFAGGRRYAFRGNSKQLSPLFNSHGEAQEWLRHNTILKEKTYGS
jgi:hypothetical protein